MGSGENTVSATNGAVTTGIATSVKAAKAAQGPAPDNVTEQLSEWLAGLRYEDVPPEVLERAKYQLLDGVACALVGARVPWSEKYVAATAEYEPAGEYSVIGYAERFGPLAAAMMNAAFIQATELDDYHASAPVHNSAIMLPVAMAAAESLQRRPGHAAQRVDGRRFLLAVIAGYETTIRAGNGLYGRDMLARGWHCGAVYGAPGAAAAAAKLFGLDAAQTEDALGIACTQACGLMAAQFGGMIKRVQHGFAARNGLIGGFLARAGYDGIKQVLERPFGGFLAMFAAGNGRDPPYRTDAVVHALGAHWETMHIRNKLYAAVGTAHGMIEILENMQRAHPRRFHPPATALPRIRRIHAAQSAAGFHHDGWSPDRRPMEVTGSQMCAAYVMATQLVDGQVLLQQFAADRLDRDSVWDLVAKTSCSHDPYFDPAERLAGARVSIEFDDGTVLEESLDAPRGYDPWVSNDQLVDKYRRLAATVIDPDRMRKIEHAVLNLDALNDASELIALLAQPVGRSLD